MNTAPSNSIIGTGYYGRTCTEIAEFARILIFPEEVNDCTPALYQNPFRTTPERKGRVECLTNTTYIIHDCENVAPPVEGTTSTCVPFDGEGDPDDFWSLKIDCAPFINGKS